MSGDRSTDSAPDSAPRPDPALIFGDALAVDRSAGYPDAFGGTIGGIPADTVVTDAFGDFRPADGYPSADAGYGDALSVTTPPARARTTPTPAEPVTPVTPVTPAAPPVPGRRRPAPPDGVLRPPGWRPGDRSPGRSTGRPGNRGPRPATQATVRGAGRMPGIPPGTVPARVSRSAADLPSGNRPRWVGRGILALVVAGLVIGNVAHGCASGLTGH